MHNRNKIFLRFKIFCTPTFFSEVVPLLARKRHHHPDRAHFLLEALLQAYAERPFLVYLAAMSIGFKKWSDIMLTMSLIVRAVGYKSWHTLIILSIWATQKR